METISLLFKKLVKTFYFNESVIDKNISKGSLESCRGLAPLLFYFKKKSRCFCSVAKPVKSLYFDERTLQVYLRSSMICFCLDTDLNG